MSRRGHAALAFNSVAGTLFRHSANAARRSHAVGAFLPCGGMRQHAHACGTSSYVVPQNGETDLVTATTTSTTTTVVAAAAAKPLRRGDIVDVRVRALDYGGGGIAELADADNHDPLDANLRVHTPKGALPGDRVRVILTKIRRPRLSEATSEFPASRMAGLGTASVLLGPVPIAEAHFIERTDRSPDAIVPPCAHFGNSHLGGGSCGGCVTMDMAYADQIAEKQRQVEKLFQNLESSTLPTIDPFVKCDRLFAYRNKMEFSFGRKWHLADPKVKKEPMLSSYGKRKTRKNKSFQAARLDTATPPVASGQEHVDKPETPAKRDYALGLHVPARFDRIVEISECHVQEPIGNKILQFIRSRCEDLKLEAYDSVNASGYMRNVGIRSARNAADELEIMVNLMTGLCEVPGRLIPLAEELLSKFPSIVSVVQNMPSVASNVSVDPSLQRLLAGQRAYLEQKLCGLSFEISANSFFQTNSYQAEKLYNEARYIAQLKPDDVLLDLFCGTGSIGLTMASYCRKVVGIELVEDAVADAKRNAKRNEITNAEFAVGDLLRLKDLPIPLLGKEQPDVIVVDPPRAGLHKDVVKFLSKTMARRIVYVSCNPASQVKDLAYLLELAPGKFAIDCVRPVDMFPHTPHIECIVGISRLQI